MLSSKAILGLLSLSGRRSKEKGKGIRARGRREEGNARKEAADASAPPKVHKIHPKVL